jgi:hypothetical protein
MLLTAVILLGLLTAYLLGSAGGGEELARAAAPAAATESRPRTLSMSGTGEGTAVPDQMSFDLAVTLLRPDLETALDDASGKMNRVLAALAGLGIERGDVQTTGLSMYPVYDYHSYAPPTLRGYRVSQRASVLVRELRSGGRAVSTAVSTGGNEVRVSDIRLRVGDVDAVLAKARDKAVADARAKAEQYARAAGLELGEVVTLHEVGPRARQAMERGYLVENQRGAADMAALPMPVRAGKDSTKVTVQVVWELG